MLALYKPNKNNKGFAASFQYSERDNTVYATILKQCGFSEQTQKGIFKDSKNDPEAHVNIKLSMTEVGGILDCIEKGRDFKKYHENDEKPKSIGFTVWKDAEGNQKGFSFSVTVTNKQDASYKNSFYIGFTFEEARTLREALVYSLHRQFEAVISRQSQSQQ
jgi:hypothetical protein